MSKEKLKKEQGGTERVRQETGINNFLEKIVVNVGVGRASIEAGFEEKTLPLIVKELAAITGQKPVFCRAKKSIAGFKMRQGQIIGLKVTLRKKRLVDFFERLVNIVLPRVRDFNGLNQKSIDKGGNLNIGLKEQFSFPEINPEEVINNLPLEITFVPKIKNREKALAAYLELGVPVKKK
ncbi:50S ribosomal protein L5 [Patescibacteria group bacterium]|nr:50S ribosomal protein L5 [Patescibacteria group bacterium]MCL5733486.1 50S ribosomal protein L5 [Patescibacteria group bacterium]